MTHHRFTRKSSTKSTCYHPSTKQRSQVSFLCDFNTGTYVLDCERSDANNEVQGEEVEWARGRDAQPRCDSSTHVAFEVPLHSHPKCTPMTSVELRLFSQGCVSNAYFRGKFGGKSKENCGQESGAN